MRYGTATALIAILVGLSASADAGPAPYKPPRNAFGQPVLEGFWTNATLTPMVREAKFAGRAAYTPDEVKAIEGAQAAGVERGNQPTDPSVGAPPVDGIVTPRGGTQIDGNYNRGWFDPGSTVMRVGGEPRTSILMTPNGQFPARRAGAPPAPRPNFSGRFDNPENLGLGDRCIIGFGRNGGPPMFSNGFYNNNYQFVQGRDAIAINIEMVHDTRIVRLGAQHRTDGLRPWFGDSVGHWEGDTLVVETTNIPQAQAYAGSWAHLTVTERFTRVGPERMLYRFTVADPTLWDQPWGGEYEFATLKGRVMEYACHEGNYAMTGILSGARHGETASAAKR